MCRLGDSTSATFNVTKLQVAYFGAEMSSVGESGRQKLLALALNLLLGGSLTFGAAAGTVNGIKDLSETSLEELMQLEVTSVAKRSQTLSKVASAVFVITAEDIRRSGALSIAEALRMAPGVQVARIDSLRYAVSMRGFNGEFSNKVLVLIDGRSVYVTGTGGVNWETVDADLDSIDRIEVIGGPAGDIWGANAVNGVINIITRNAADTTGAAAEIGTGTVDQFVSSFRYGAQRRKFAYRVYGKSLRRAPLGNSTGIGAGRDWISSRAGFRIDAGERTQDTLTLTGDVYDSHAGQDSFQTLTAPPYARILSEDTRSWGGHLYGRWTRRHSNGSSHLQAYFDGQYGESQLLNPCINTVDFEYLREFSGPEGHSFLAGGGVRFVAHRYPSIFGPEASKNQNYSLLNSLLQDDITIVEDHLVLTAGAKLEKSSLASPTVQPTLRLAFTPTAKQTFWSAITHSNRTPSRIEEDVDLIATYTPMEQGLLASRIVGNRDLGPETVTALETGYRIQPRKDVSIDTSLFHNSYRKLIGIDSSATFAYTSDGTLIATSHLDNAYSATTYGAEVSAGWAPVDNLRLSGTYSRLNILTTNGDNLYPRNPRGRSPLNQGTFRASYTGSAKHRFDLDLYCVGTLWADRIPAYQRLDLHWEWKLTEALTLSVLGSDLLRPRHYEFQSEGFTTLSPLKRGASVKLRWDF
jgi:iron complex outermembrane recepter protein